jgi:hypothetical protein
MQRGGQMRAPTAHQVKQDGVAGQPLLEDLADCVDRPIIDMHDQAGKAVKQRIVALINAAKKFVWHRLGHGILNLGAIVKDLGPDAQNRCSPASFTGLEFTDNVK